MPAFDQAVTTHSSDDPVVELRQHKFHPVAGQGGSIDDLYRHHGIDSDAILDACAAACLDP